MNSQGSKGIFCLEGDWWNDLIKPSSIEPTLRQLATIGLRYVRRDVGTREEFEHYLKKWCNSRHARYQILYLAFHGRPGLILMGDRRMSGSVADLDSIEDSLRARCHNRVIYFGSCLTLAVHGNRLNRFLKETEALAVCGYTKEVDWILSAALDLIVFRALSNQAFTKAGMRAAEKRIFADSAGLARSLDFRMAIRH